MPLADFKTLSVNVLPPEARSLVAGKSIKARKRLADLIDLLNMLSDFDKKRDAIHEKVKAEARFFGIGIFICVGLAIVVTIIGVGSLIVFGICGAAVSYFVLGMCYYGIKLSRLTAIDLDNSFRETLLPLLHILKEDIDPKGKITIEMDLGLPSEKKYKVNEFEIVRVRNNRITRSTFLVDSIRAEIPLMNKTLLNLHIRKNALCFDRRYRNSNGKNKSKMKWKQITTVTCGLEPVKDEFAVNAPDIEKLGVNEKVKVKDKNEYKTCKMIRKIKTGPSPDPINANAAPDMILSMFMALCSTLKPASLKEA